MKPGRMNFPGSGKTSTTHVSQPLLIVLDPIGHLPLCGYLGEEVQGQPRRGPWTVVEVEVYETGQNEFPMSIKTLCVGWDPYLASQPYLFDLLARDENRSLFMDGTCPVENSPAFDGQPFLLGSSKDRATREQQKEN